MKIIYKIKNLQSFKNFLYKKVLKQLMEVYKILYENINIFVRELKLEKILIKYLNEE